MKKQILSSVVFLAASCGLFPTVFSQDIHFSQFYQAPLLMNPALTGAFNGDQRATLNHKDQWRSVGSPYQTSLFSFDMAFMKKKWKSAYLGTGLMVFRDKAGDTQLGTTQINFSASGIVYISDNQKISAGLQGGFAQKSINTAKMEWASQFDGTGFASNLASGETSAFEPYSFSDFSAGISWSYGAEESQLFANNEFKANAGASLFHVNRPEQKFNAYQEADRLYSKIVAHAGIHIGIGNTNFAVQPSLFYMKQGAHREINAGSFIRYKLREESKYTGILKETAISLGGYLRARDAIIPSLLFEYGHFALGITYDVNISSLKEVSNKRGGMELSLQFVNPNPFRAGAGKSVRFL